MQRLLVIALSFLASSLVIVFGFCSKFLRGGEDLRMMVLFKNECSLSVGIIMGGKDTLRLWADKNFGLKWNCQYLILLYLQSIGC